jgi:preprotein translocase subunit SecG
VNILSGILTSLIIVTSLFMICLVLIQRGKGGGLAGAFGGMGGSSAFGTKAGDVFTRVTMITALIWILFCMILVVLYNRGTTSAWDSDTPKAAAGRAKEVPPTAAGGKGPAKGTATGAAKDKAPSSAPAPKTGGGTANAPAPVDVPAIPDEAPKK